MSQLVSWLFDLWIFSKMSHLPELPTHISNMDFHYKLRMVTPLSWIHIASHQHPINQITHYTIFPLQFQVPCNVVYRWQLMFCVLTLCISMTLMNIGLNIHSYRLWNYQVLDHELLSIVLINIPEWISWKQCRIDSQLSIEFQVL